MKLLYFTTATNQTEYEKIQKASRVKASVASQVFESALLKGLSDAEGLELTLYSFPMIASFPGSKLIFWGARAQTVDGGRKTTWLPTVNLYGLKQFTQRISAFRVLKRWLKENANESDKAILLYSVYEPIASQVLRCTKKHHCKTVVIVPDLPRDMYKVLSRNRIKAAMQKRYMRRAVACQDKFDGYIYLTEAMTQAVAPGKPYTVVEGLADVSFVRYPVLAEKAKPRAVMYAGAISRKYGLDKLVEAFQSLAMPDTELWLFGAGDWSDELQKLTECSTNIRYFGRVSREDVLQWERRATLLVNVRDPNEAFTKYSFPSKTIEYLLSGTPLMTTKLGGIPQDYASYLYFISDNSAETIREKLRELLSMPAETLLAKGEQAQQFIMNEKNETTQASRLLSFVKKV